MKFFRIKLSKNPELNLWFSISATFREAEEEKKAVKEYEEMMADLKAVLLKNGVNRGTLFYNAFRRDLEVVVNSYTPPPP